MGRVPAVMAGLLLGAVALADPVQAQREYRIVER